MKILVLNAGSSSLKYKLYIDMEPICSGLVEEIASGGFVDAIGTMEQDLVSVGVESLSDLDAIGHRVVHGGESFKSSVVIDSDVIAEIERLIPLAPLHNSVNLDGIRVGTAHAPTVPQVAVFDTAFHQTLEKSAYMYALPYELYESYGVRRYGFHGTSHMYVAHECADRLGMSIDDINLITIHLGNGASVCAIEQGRSIDTSMGFTPLEGLMMGSRSGDIDPAIVLYLQREHSYTVEQIDTMLNSKSGLKGICSVSDMRQINLMIEQGDSKALLAHDMFCRRVGKYIGAYHALLGRVDAVVFTGGIGEHDSMTREKIAEYIRFDTIQMVIPTDEELVIARETSKLVISKHI